jgi:hypothetical protein
MNPNVLDDLARKLATGADRRMVLRGVAGGATGFGAWRLGQTGVDASAIMRLQSDDPCARTDLVLFAAQVADFSNDLRCEGCECQGRRVIYGRQEFRGFVLPEQCDEFRGRYAGEHFVGTLERWLREDPICGTFTGFHAGRFAITDASGNPLVEGQIAGTDGLTSDPKLAEDCCGPGLGEGTLVGQGVSELRGCTFTASYSTVRDEGDPCDSGLWGGWRWRVVGFLACPCNDSGCPGDRKCVDFRELGEQELPAPYDDPATGATFSNGQLVILGFGGSFIGLNVNTVVTIKLPEPACQAEVTLVHYANDPVLPIVTGYAGGNQVFQQVAGPTRDQEQTFVITSQDGVEEVIVEAPSDETLLVRFCYTPR